MGFGLYGHESVANEDSESESEEESETSESEEESDSETSGLDLDVCPPGCDQNLYDSTCLLREKRVDVDEKLMEERTNKETMIRDLDAMQKKAKLTEEAIQTVEQELRASQVAIVFAFEICSLRLNAAVKNQNIDKCSTSL